MLAAYPGSVYLRRVEPQPSAQCLRLASDYLLVIFRLQQLAVQNLHILAEATAAMAETDLRAVMR